MAFLNELRIRSTLVTYLALELSVFVDIFSRLFFLFLVFSSCSKVLNIFFTSLKYWLTIPRTVFSPHKIMNS